MESQRITLVDHADSEKRLQVTVEVSRGGIEVMRNEHGNPSIWIEYHAGKVHVYAWDTDADGDDPTYKLSLDWNNVC